MTPPEDPTPEMLAAGAAVLDRNAHSPPETRAHRESGTGHEVFESWRQADMLPTHYRVLEPVPARILPR